MLDIKTLMMLYVIINIISAGAVAVIWGQNRGRFAGITFWLVDMILQAAGAVFIVLRGLVPDLVSMVLANTMIQVGALILFIGLERFTGKKGWQIHNYILLTVLISIITYYSLVQPDLTVREIALAGMTIIFTFQCCWLLLRRVDPGMRQITRLTGMVFAGYVVFDFIRILLYITIPLQSTDFFKSGTVVAFAITMHIVLSACLAISLVLMVNRRLLADVKAQEEKFTMVFQSSPYAITLTKLSDGRILEVNDGFERITGYQCAEVIGKTTLDLHLWVKEEDRMAVVSELTGGREVHGVEYQFYKKSGELLTGLFSANLIRVNNEKYILSGIGDITERKQAEEALRESNAYLENLFNYANAPIIVWNTKFHITRFNRAFEKLTGRSATEIIGQSLEVLFPPGNVKNSMALLRETQAGARLETIEIQIQQNQGQVRTLLWNSANVLGADGQTLIATIAQGYDITERKQAEEALRESNAYLENLFNYANAPIIVWDTKFRITRFNRAFEKLTGRSATEIIGQSLEVLFPPGNVKNSMALLRETQAGARLETIEIQIQQNQGQVRTLLWNSANILGADGQTLIATIAQGHDITERKQAEEELHRLAEVVRHSSELVNLATAEGKMIFINDAGARILGIDPDDVDQLDIIQVIPDHLKEKVQSELLPALLEGGTWTGDLQYINAKTRLLTDVHAMAFALKDTATGAVQYLANVSLDITERKRAEEKLKKAFEELERFAYTISHDLKSPLVTIKTFLGYLRQDIPGADARNIEKDVSFIEGAADKMSRLLDELLEMSRVGRVVNPPEAVTFGEIVQEALNMVAGGIRERGVAVRVGSETLSLYGDRPRLVEIWQNLLENAVKFMGEQASPSIDIGFEQKGTDTVFFVRDNGMGVDPLYKSRIFNLFDKLDAKAEGTGLGLAIVRRIVELYEGVVWLESDGPGRGSCFLFTLPAAVQDEIKGERV